MKILQLGKFYPIGGGVEKVMYDLMLGLSARGVDCDMMCAIKEAESRVEKLNDNANLICCSALTKAAATMLSPSMVQTLYKVSQEYDIIHIHHPDPMACVALYFSGYKGRVVLHWHSDILKQKHLLKLYQPFQNWMIQRADIIVGTTPIYISESPYLTDVQHKTTYLPIGVVSEGMPADTNNHIKERYAGKKIIFSLGRLVEYKGYTYLIDAAKYLSDEYIILIGGTGPLRKKLQAQIDAEGLGDKVKLLGYVTDEELPLYYDACSLFVLSSVYKTEAFGIVQIEAMSHSRPVIATTIAGSGTHWVNAHQESGLNVTPGNSQELAQAIVDITGDKDRYELYCKNARNRYEQVFTYEKMIDNCLEIYKSIMK
ncbi:MAG: glycosyltransferase [Alistipes sp.]|nr:glycosyltransferase [Alistipes sp.]